MTAQTSARVTLWVNRIILGLLAVLFFTLPGIMDFYSRLRPLSREAHWAVIIAFYFCFGLVAYGLFSVDRLMVNILAEKVFVPENVSRIRHIRWCCAGVSFGCLPASFFYPPLIFMVIVMAFLALVVSVVKSVMAAAVELREENDLTV